MKSRKEVKEHFENIDICKTVLFTSNFNYSLAIEVCVDTVDNSVTYHVTDGTEFCYGIYDVFNDAVDDYFNRKEKLENIK